MAITNQDRVGKALDLLRDGLSPYVQRELKAKFGERWNTEVKTALSDRRLGASKGDPLQDIAVILVVMDKTWGQVFGAVLGRSDRSLVLELLDARHKWAHQEKFTGDDVYRVLDSAGRLLSAVTAPQADEVERQKAELLRVRFEDQVRGEKRKSAGTAIESQAAATLTPWREVIDPHKDVASGKYQQAEFAADLWQVHLGEGTSEYRDPGEFFRRTFLTDSLKMLLVGAVQRLNGEGGDPVVQLQTNFGGGKTHSMLALYHLFSGASPSELPGADTVLAEAGLTRLPKARRVVLVGNKISPGNPVTKPDGTVVRTLWGELAWQLGGKKAYARIKLDDERATSPGDALRELMKENGPCLILIDEWVAYARQLHDQGDLPAGGFETQFTFAQALTESAKAAGNCLLVISLPASDTAGSPHTMADDVEVGGIRGREALDRLRNVVGRVESSWRPATAEEGFEIVRRRLFEPLTAEQFKKRDVVAREFFELYRSQAAEFPPECRDADYEKRIRAAYPIHPEVFDRLYTDWSTLVKFQRTRGVLRLMAAVIHSLWEKNDRNPLILPSMIPIDDPRVQFELTRYLSDNWVPVIAKDVDGPNSLPMHIDAQQSATLGKYQATRRVARTIYLGSAPMAGAANLGIEDRRIKLGCVLPGESPNIFGDALRRLTGAATYLYQDGARYWYALQPTVTKLAEDRAEQYKRNPDAVAEELENRIRADLADKSGFSRVHWLPASGADVPDDTDARLVILRPDYPHSKEPGSAAESAAQAILEMRGNAPRLFRNTLVFLAPDQARLQGLEDAMRKYLAWESIVAESETLNLSGHQKKQAEAQLKAADGAVKGQLPEAYQWLLVPTQKNPQAPVVWQAQRLTVSESLAARASKKLRSDELLIGTFAGTRLRMELDRIPLWSGDSVAVEQLVQHFARYIYLPRLAGPAVLAGAVRDGLKLLTWSSDTFAFADSWDEAGQRFLGLRAGEHIDLSDSAPVGLLVRPDVALRQMEKERPAPVTPGPVVGPGDRAPEPDKPVTGGPKPALPKRYHGSVELDPLRAGRDAGKIAEEVITHLTALVGARVKVTLEIEADIPAGAPDTVVRTVTENGRTLKFSSQGFHTE